MLLSANAFHGRIGRSERPSWPPWKSTAKPNTTSATSSIARKIPSSFAVSSTWKNESAAIAISGTKSSRKTGTSTLSQSWIVVFAKYAVTPITEAEKMMYAAVITKATPMPTTEPKACVANE